MSRGKSFAAGGIHSRASLFVLDKRNNLQPGPQLRASHSCGNKERGRQRAWVHGSFVREKCGGACIASKHGLHLSRFFDSKGLASETQSMMQRDQRAELTFR